MNDLPLADLEPGELGRLLPAEGEAARRLRDLGFVAGTTIGVLRRGPLGDPIELELRGYRVCVRRADLSGLRVEPLAGVDG
jgi:ferrous iron transport protein A